MAYQTLLQNLQQWGLLDFVLPVLLIFTAAFGILQKIKIFGEGTAAARKPNKKVNLILALGIALGATIPHFTGQGPDIVLIMAQLLPNSFVIVLALMISLLLLSLVSPTMKPSENVSAGILAIIALVALVVVILQAGGIVSIQFLNFLLEPNTLAIVIVILVFALVIWFIQRKELTDAERAAAANEKAFKSLRESFGKLFGG